MAHLCLYIILKKEETNMFENYPDVINVQELAEMLHIGRNSAYELINSRQIPSVKVKSQIRISKENVINYLRGATPQAPRLHFYGTYPKGVHTL